jgi:hypothetical protein
MRWNCFGKGDDQFGLTARYATLAGHLGGRNALLDHFDRLVVGAEAGRLAARLLLQPRHQAREIPLQGADLLLLLIQIHGGQAVAPVFQPLQTPVQIAADDRQCQQQQHNNIEKGRTGHDETLTQRFF